MSMRRFDRAPSERITRRRPARPPPRDGPVGDIARSLMTGAFRADSADIEPKDAEPPVRTDLTVDAVPETGQDSERRAAEVGPRRDASSASSFLLGSRDSSGVNKNGK